jgi:hypothetical protein
MESGAPEQEKGFSRNESEWDQRFDSHQCGANFRRSFLGPRVPLPKSKTPIGS